jgi:tetrahydromethanopterin S-methyltransferase subunit G
MFTPEQQKSMKKVITDPDTNEIIKTKWDDMENKLKEMYPKINKNVEKKAPVKEDTSSDDLPFN